MAGGTPTTPATPVTGETPQTPATVAPQRPGQGVVVMPGETPEKEKHTIPPEIPYPRFHMARGGWKRVSMFTVQSDDKRFTITHVDPTRRSDWFLLKDLETGESHEFTTMTDAKKKAKEIRGEADDSDPYADEGESVHEDDNNVDAYADHEYCSECGECTTCNLRPCRDGGEHKISATKTPNRTAKKAVEDTMARPIQETKQAPKWARLRQVATDEPKEADAAIAEVADALGTMADALSNLRENLDLIEAPKTASVKVRIAAARKYASAFRRMAEETPEVVAEALSEVYHSLDDVAGAIENLAENMGIELSLTPAEEAFAEEGKEELAGEAPEAPGEVEVDEEEFAEAESELESPEGEAAEENLDEEIEKEAGSTEWTTDRDEEGKPKPPVIAAAKECSQCGPGHEDPKKPGYCERHGKKIPKAKKADGSAGFVTDRDNNAKPEAPAKTEAPEAQGDSEVNKAAALRDRIRQRIAKRWHVEV